MFKLYISSKNNEGIDVEDVIKIVFIGIGDCLDVGYKRGELNLILRFYV